MMLGTLVFLAGMCNLQERGHSGQYAALRNCQVGGGLVQVAQRRKTMETVLVKQTVIILTWSVTLALVSHYHILTG